MSTGTWGLQLPQVNNNMDLFNGTGQYATMNSYGQPAAAAPVAAPAAASTLAGAGAGSMSQSLGMNIPTLQLGLGGLQTLTGLYTGLKSLGLAQDQFNFQKGMAQTNLRNSVASYNTSLEDRARSRAAVEGQTDAQRQSYVNANKLST